MTIGWSDFWRKQLDTYPVVPNCYRTPILKFQFEMLLFGVLQGLWKFYCYPKMDKTILIEPAPGGIFFVADFFKS